MQSKEHFWKGENMEAATMCEDKNCRLFYEVLGGTFYIVRKYSDGSILHTPETQLFKSHSIIEISNLIKTI